MKKTLVCGLLLGINVISFAQLSPADVKGNSAFSNVLKGNYTTDNFAETNLNRSVDRFSEMAAKEYAASLALTADQKDKLGYAIRVAFKKHEKPLPAIAAGQRVSVLNSVYAQNELNEKLKDILTYSQYIKYQSLHDSPDIIVNGNGVDFRI